MKGSKYVLGILLLAGIIMAGCSKPKNIQFIGYRNLQLLHPDFSGAEVQMDLIFLNPNRYALWMKEAKMNLLVNNVQLGRLEEDTLIYMAPNDTFYYPLKVKVNIASLLTNFMSSNLQDSVTIQATGSCKVGRNGLFIQLPINYENKGKLKLY
jgi:LEA14-like dessication related protein